MDRGTENVMIEDIQAAFHSEYAPQQEKPCVIKSASPHNQVGLLLFTTLLTNVVW